MANCKEVEIVARLRWDWASQLPDSEAACFAGLLLNPAVGVHIHQEDIGYVPNDNGGQTSMYRVTLSGIEALNAVFLSRLVSALASVGTVDEAWARDIENNLDWESIVA